MSNIRYYISIFARRMPWFLIVAGLISGFAVAVAITLPPAYVSSTRLLVESSQIPGQLAAPTVQMSGEERLQLFETQLLTRANLLEIARDLDVLPDQRNLSPDEIVAGMRSRTRIRNQAGRNRATLMTISFESEDPRKAAAVLNEYLTRVLNLDTEYRTGRATQTQQFFEQEVQRLGEQLDQQSGEILRFKTEHADALPDAQDFRRNRQTALQERLVQTERDISTLEDQKQRLEQVFQATGQVRSGEAEVNRSPDEIALDKARAQLREALLIYSETNPRVKMLQSRVDQLAQVVADAGAETAGSVVEDTPPVNPTRTLYDLQVAELDSKLASLTDQKDRTEKELVKLEDAIARTAANAIALEALQRDYKNIQEQYNQASARLATASTGERIELLSRGQRVTVVEQPSVPTEPTKPNRLKLGAAGVGAGVLAGAALIALLEMLNTSARRPIDLVNGLGITPLATVPYLRTRREKFRRRASLIAVILVIGAAIPASIYAVHTYYQPLDLIADRIMNKLGVRG
ncbi:GumC family protein [Pseudooceanicola nitratireducens]|uniref:GumC family protein n=1 Tax=Pseudooceanicola nitratireducens TaxID=517719 RepID=UPI001C96DE00|nr:lipopolysaccharide biosynthesis [Pseudooceanicola nitratireducens]MBY6159176.1 lipopolysaccharide biosynthesis [Pseudooceanicola nitratireducens]